MHDEICMNKNRIFGLRRGLKENILVDSMKHNGDLINSFGKNYTQRNFPSKILYKNLNFLDSQASPTPFSILGGVITYIPQLMYNAATMIPERMEAANLPKTIDQICHPLSITCNDKNVFVLDYNEFPTNRVTHYDGKIVSNIAIFDNNGNPIKKILSFGYKEDSIHIDTFHNNPCIKANENNLYVFDMSPDLKTRLRQFDFDGNLEKTIFNEFIDFNTNSYCDSSLDEHNFYTVVEDGDGWDKVARINLTNGKLDITDFSSRMSLIDAIATGDDKVFVHGMKKIITLTKDMKFISEDSTKDVLNEDDWLEYRDSMEYYKEHLYFPGFGDIARLKVE